MADLVQATKTAVVVTKNRSGRRTRTTINAGKLYRADDPVVVGREGLFRAVSQDPAAQFYPVEQATAAPGEVRTTRRRRPKKAAEAPPAEAAAGDASPAASGDDAAKGDK